MQFRLKLASSVCCGSLSFFIIMNEEVVEKLQELVKHITETGEWVLDSKDLKVNVLLVKVIAFLTYFFSR